VKKALSVFKNLPFKYKILLSYLIVILIPVLSLGIYSYSQSTNFLEKQERRSLTNAVEKIADHLSYKISIYNNITDFIVYNTPLQQLFNNNYKDNISMAADLKAKLEPTVSNIQFINKDIQEVTFYSKTGMPEYGTLILDYTRIRDEHWAVRTEGSYVPNWFLLNGKLFIARKLVDIYSDKELGIVYLGLDYNAVFKETLFPDSLAYDLFITNNDKDVIYSNQTKVDARQIYDSSRYIAVEKRIAGSEWTLYCYVPYDFILKESGQIISATVIVCIACILFLLLVIWAFSNTLVKRINGLNLAMKKVEYGQLSMDISSNSTDEIGQLTNRFGKMLKTINHLIEDVYQSKIVQKEAELKALQAQIRPHFLYNSLNIINWRAIMNNDAETSSIATRLSEFYRTTLNKGDNVISIRDEMVNMKAYIDIQLIMHEHNFDVHYDIDEEVYSFDMLNLILQPLVENAIEHGIDCKTEGRGELKITAVMSEEDIRFSVADNGPGLDSGQLGQLINKQTSGYGLKNVNERLRLYFGPEYRVEIESGEGAGTVCSFRIPKYVRQQPLGLEPSEAGERRALG